MESLPSCLPVRNVGCSSLTFFELLPATKSSQRNAIQFTPAERLGSGKLVIGTQRGHTAYMLTEFATDPRFADGRGFRLEKLDPLTDPASESYSLFCHRLGEGHTCECKGFEYTGSCKHLAALLALILNGWI